MGTLPRNSGVLIVDDDDAICYSLAREARRVGAIPLVAGDGFQALQIFDAAKVEVGAAFLDVCMPRLDGPAALRGLRQRQPDLGICLMSARVDAAFVRRLDPGVRFLAKPFNLDDFSRLLRELLGARPVGVPLPPASPLSAVARP